jgi:hypothetical protein
MRPHLTHFGKVGALFTIHFAFLFWCHTIDVEKKIKYVRNAKGQSTFFISTVYNSVMSFYIIIYHM